MREIKHWVDGAAVAGTSGRHLPVWDPAIGEQQAYVAAATKNETGRAVASALAAFPAWRRASLSRRAEVMFRFRDLVDANRKEIASLVSQEHGKTVADAGGELARGIENIEFATGAPHLLKGGYSEQAATASTCTRSGSRSGWSPASRRSTSPPWCRCGCSATPWSAATRSSSSPARRTRRSRCSWPTCCGKRGCRTARSTSCRVTGRRSRR